MRAGLPTRAVVLARETPVCRDSNFDQIKSADTTLFLVSYLREASDTTLSRSKPVS